jgi:hypothetical protein
MQGNVVQVEDARLSVPDGGIASFVPDDDEIDDGEDFGSEGIAQFPALAQRMAAMGRGGDDTLAHVQTGELIIPAALLAQDPALKEGLFQRLRDMGIEDPERYVVGRSRRLQPTPARLDQTLKTRLRPAESRLPSRWATHSSPEPRRLTQRPLATKRTPRLIKTR